MKDELITFELAVLAKNKGFTQQSYPCFADDGKLHTVSYFRITYPDKKSYFQSTQSLLQRWLREVHHIHIGIWYNTLTSKYRWERQLSEDYIDSNEEFDIYELALSEGLTEALKLLL